MCPWQTETAAAAAEYCSYVAIRSYTMGGKDRERNEESKEERGADTISSCAHYGCPMEEQKH